MEIETQVLEEVVKDKNNLQEVKLTRRKIQSIKKDPEKSAKAVNLIYVTDKQPGIKRIKEENDFLYRYKNKIIDDDVTLGADKEARIASCVGRCVDLRQRKRASAGNWHRFKRT